MVRDSKNLNIYYDFEFLEGEQHKYFLGVPFWKTKPTIDMISLGMVIDDGRTTKREYIICKDFNIDEAWNRYDITDDWKDGLVSLEIARQHKIYWLRENVLKPIWVELEYIDRLSPHAGRTLEEFQKLYIPKLKFTKERFKYLIEKYGKSRDEVRTILDGIVEGYDNVSLYGYYSSYDHVLFSWIFGKMVDLPSNINKFTYDLKPYLNEYLEKFKKDNIYFSNDKFLFNGDSKYNLSDILDFVKKNTNYPQLDPKNEHHALNDAVWISKLYTFLKKEGFINT